MEKSLVNLNPVESMDNQARNPRAMGTCFGESDVDSTTYSFLEMAALGGLPASRGRVHGLSSPSPRNRSSLDLVQVTVP